MLLLEENSIMEIDNVKALIKSLVVSSTVPYSVPQLLNDFENEAGVELPIYNFSNPKTFLMSLTDIIQFVGPPPNEKIIPVQNGKSKHISSLIERQGKGSRYKHSFSHPDLISHKNFGQGKTPQVLNKIKSKDVSKVQVKVSNKKTPNEEGTNKIDESVCANNFEEFIFKEDEIKNINKCNESSPRFALASTPKTKECDNISTADTLSSSNNSSTSGFVNDSVKERLGKLMKKQTRGIWCCDFPDLYKDSYEFPLEFKEFGYRSLIDMVKELSEIFRCLRPGNGDWLLFDASKPPSEEELNIYAISRCDVPEDIEKNLLKLIESHCANGSKPGIYLDDLLVLYFREFRRRLNFTELGFPNIKSLVNKLEGRILQLDRDGQRFIIKPVLEQNVISQEIEIFITPEDDVFNELFPHDVVKQGECFVKLEIEKYFSVGEKIYVNVADVWSPEKFYVQLKQYEHEFCKLRNEIQQFYNLNVNKYKMPDPTIQPNQICVVLHTNEDGFEEWHRSLIVNIANRDEVVLDFVDYGNRMRMSKANIRFMHQYFLRLPAQSFAAKLSFVESPGRSVWPLKTCKKFLELVTVPTVEFHIKTVDLEKETINGVIISVNGKERIDVGEALVQEGMAVYGGSKTANRTTSLKTGNTSAVRNVPLLVESVPEERIYESIKSEAKENIKMYNEKFLVPKNVEMYTGNGTRSSVHDNADKQFQYYNNSKCMEIVERFLSATDISKLQNVCTTDSNMAQIISTSSLKLDVYALAFWLLSTNELVKEAARVNLDNGLLLALNLAQQLTDMPGFS